MNGAPVAVLGAHPCDRNDTVTQLCESIMTEVYETCTTRDPIAHAARIMRARKTRFVPVVESSGLIGLLTDTDVIGLAVAEGLGAETPVGRILPQRPMVTVMPEDSVQTAWKKMNESGVNRLMVVGRHGMVIGAISRSDLVALQRTRRNTTRKVAGDSSRRGATGNVQ